MPLLRGYAVVVATIAPATGAVTLGTRPLFRPGDTQGAESVLTFRRAPGDRGAATLAVTVADQPSSHVKGDGSGLDVVSLHEIPLPGEPVFLVGAVSTRQAGSGSPSRAGSSRWPGPGRRWSRDPPP